MEARWMLVRFGLRGRIEDVELGIEESGVGNSMEMEMDEWKRAAKWRGEWQGWDIN